MLLRNISTYKNVINKIILTVNKCRYLFHETFLSVKMIKLAHAFLVSALCLVVARVVGVCYYHSEPVCILLFFLYYTEECLVYFVYSLLLTGFFVCYNTLFVSVVSLAQLYDVCDHTLFHRFLFSRTPNP